MNQTTSKSHNLVTQYNYTIMQVANIERSVSMQYLMQLLDSMKHQSLQEQHKALIGWFAESNEFPKLLMQGFLWVLLSKGYFKPLRPVIEIIKPEFLETVQFNRNVVSLIDWRVDQDSNGACFCKIFHTVQERKNAEQMVETFWDQVDKIKEPLTGVVETFPVDYNEFVEFLANIELNRLLGIFIYNRKAGNQHFEMQVFE